MTADPRAALDRLIAAFEGHLRALEARRGEDDPVLERAYATLADAYEAYDESLAENYGESTPFYLDDHDDDDDLDDDDLAVDVDADDDDDELLDGLDVDLDGSSEDDLDDDDLDDDAADADFDDDDEDEDDDA